MIHRGVTSDILSGIIHNYEPHLHISAAKLLLSISLTAQSAFCFHTICPWWKDTTDYLIAPYLVDIIMENMLCHGNWQKLTKMSILSSPDHRWPLWASGKSISLLNGSSEKNFPLLSPEPKYIVRIFKETFLIALHIILPKRESSAQ